MIVGVITIKLHTPWVHSLKEKRMVVKSIISKVRNKFNVSIAEVDEQDTHQIIIIGLACVVGTVVLLDSTVEKVIRFIEDSSDAEILDIQREIR